VLRWTLGKICRGSIRGKSRLLFTIELQLMLSLNVRDINIISIERLLHCLLSGKLSKIRSST
jgi:hypothetical protein